MANNIEDIIQTNTETSIERRKNVYEAIDYGDLTLVELKFEEMYREVGRIKATTTGQIIIFYLSR